MLPSSRAVDNIQRLLGRLCERPRQVYPKFPSAITGFTDRQGRNLGLHFRMIMVRVFGSLRPSEIAFLKAEGYTRNATEKFNRLRHLRDGESFNRRCSGAVAFQSFRRHEIESFHKYK